MKILPLLLLVLLVSSISALSETIVPYSYYPPQTQSQSTQQFYTVTFDGEGEAAVAAKFTFVQKPMKTILIEVPGRNIRLINAIQEAKSLLTQCAEYKTQCTAGDERVCTQYYPDGTCKTYETIHNPCFRQEQQCIRSQQSYGWPYTYHPIKYTQEFLSKSTLFTLTLPIDTDEPTILLYYKAQGYAQKSAGVWHANFETAKISDDTEQVRVALNVIPDLHLKGGKASVDYNTAFLSATKLTSAMESSELSDFSRQMEYTQGYVKQSSALDPWESFHVKADYSSSAVLLYKGRILLISLAVLSLIGASILGIKKLKPKSMPSSVRPIAIGTLSAFLIYALAFSAYWMLNNMYRWINSSGELVVVLLVIVVIISILALLIAPSIYYGIKNGLSAGMLTFATTMITLIIFGILIVVFLLSIFKTQIMY
ncbi:MAG TPA: hypothetical protein VJK72_04490 [Candidatus Nanoarchaeia archaeon]|nr:hypothetical protein [Candidatus Nanoarchaeia archaeon]